MVKTTVGREGFPLDAPELGEVVRISKPSKPVSLKPTDRLSISEFADVIGFTPSEVISAIERSRHTHKGDFYSIPELAVRWRCSRATVYRVLRESEFKCLDLSLPARGEDSTKSVSSLRRGNAEKGKRLIPVSIVQRIEQSRMRPLSEAA